MMNKRIKATGENQMSVKPVITALIMSATLFTASFALAGPDLTPEQLAKAREVASQMKPPVDFDALLAEADRLSVDCEGDLTRRAIIKMCKFDVETAQSKERIEASKERQAKLDEEIEASKERQAKLDAESARLDEEAIRMINELSDKAEQKLKQNQ